MSNNVSFESGTDGAVKQTLGQDSSANQHQSKPKATQA